MSSVDAGLTQSNTEMPPARDAARAMRALMSLQSSGSKLADALRTRERMVQIMDIYLKRLDIDVHQLPPVVHIAGTKGKGSTASMCESILRQHGLKTGLFTSPHLVDVRERFRVGGRPISEETYLRYFWQAWDTLQEKHAASTGVSAEEAAASSSAGGAASQAVPHVGPVPLELLPPVPGFFYFLTLLGFMIFRGEGVQALVLEVGIGGRLDATNVVPQPLVTGVTTLDFDHMDLLGDTLASIANEKAGIFKKGVPAFTVPQRADALVQLGKAARNADCSLYVCDPASVAARTHDKQFPPLGLDGSYQRINAALAVAMSETFLKRLEQRSSEHANTEAEAAPLPVYAPAEPLAPATLEGLRTAHWPGRSHIVPLPAAPDNCTLYVDGAHTERSMQRCLEWFRQTVEQRRRSESDGAAVQHKMLLVFYCGHEKDALQLLLPLSTVGWDRAYITGVEWSRPSPHSLPTTDSALATFLEKKRKMEDWRAISEIQQATAAAAEAASSVAASSAGSDALLSKGSSAPWQDALAGMWRAVHSRPEFSIIRQRLVLPLDEYAAPASASSSPTSASASAATPSAAPSLPSAMPPTHIETSVREVLASIAKEATEGAATATRPRVHYHVLVTGSLYLVGSVLQTVGWSDARE
jgi:folylpolyglutamate synthase/dihydrofolate synthase